MLDRPKLGPKLFSFFHLFKFGSLGFPEVTENDSLEHCLTGSGGKTCKENVWASYWVQN